jgi:hypothetical protein
MNTTNELLSFLSTYEQYLNGYNTLITPENYQYFKENGCFQPTTKEEKLQKKLLLGGWNFKKLWSDFYNGDLTLEQLNEFKANGCLTDDDFKKQENYWEDELMNFCLSGSEYIEETITKWLNFFENLNQ